MYNLTCVGGIEEYSNVMVTCSDQWEMIRNTLINLNKVKVSSIETLMVHLKDNNKLLPEKADLHKIRDLLLGLGDII